MTRIVTAHYRYKRPPRKTAEPLAWRKRLPMMQADMDEV